MPIADREGHFKNFLGITRDKRHSGVSTRVQRRHTRAPAVLAAERDVDTSVLRSARRVKAEILSLATHTRPATAGVLPAGTVAANAISGGLSTRLFSVPINLTP